MKLLKFIYDTFKSGITLVLAAIAIFAVFVLVLVLIFGPVVGAGMSFENGHHIAGSLFTAFWFFLMGLIFGDTFVSKWLHDLFDY